MTLLPEMGLALLAGLLSTLSPCIFPLLPIVLGGSLQRHRLAPVAMGAGMVLSFALLGLLLGLAGDALGLDPETVRLAGAVALVLLGAAMLVPALSERLGRWLAPLATGANTASAHLDAASLAGAFLTGGLLGMIWTPCSGPLLGSAVAMVATEGGALRGTTILGAFGLGAAAVVVAVAYVSRAALTRVREWLMTHGESVRKAFGVVVMLLGIAILTDADRWLETRVLDLLPDAWVQLTTRI